MNNKKIKPTDYEQSVASAFIAGGIFVGAVVLVFIAVTIFADLSDFRTAPVFVLGIVLIGALISVGYGIYKNAVFSKKQYEFDDFRRLGKKHTGKITSVKNALNADYGNRSSHNNNSAVIIAVCTVTDEETGEETTYYSRKLACNGNIVGMNADVYTYPSGQYYVDTENLRSDIPAVAGKVHDFR